MARDILVTTIHRPFSYLHDARAFPKEIEIWDRTGKVLHKVASLPLEDRVPINGVIVGPRSIQWRPTDSATLMWVEALDKGDLKNKVPNRDRLLALKAPFTGEPREVVKTEQRFSGLQFFEKGGRAFIEDSERQTRRVRTFQIEVDDPGQTPKLVWSRNAQDRYKDPGTPMLKAPPLRRRRHPPGRRQHLPHRTRRRPQGRPPLPGPLQHRHRQNRAPLPVR